MIIPELKQKETAEERAARGEELVKAYRELVEMARERFRNANHDDGAKQILDENFLPDEDGFAILSGANDTELDAVSRLLGVTFGTLEFVLSNYVGMLGILESQLPSTIKVKTCAVATRNTLESLRGVYPLAVIRPIIPNRLEPSSLIELQKRVENDQSQISAVVAVAINLLYKETVMMAGRDPVTLAGCLVANLLKLLEENGPRYQQTVEAARSAAALAAFRAMAEEAAAQDDEPEIEAAPEFQPPTGGDKN